VGVLRLIEVEGYEPLSFFANVAIVHSIELF